MNHLGRIKSWTKTTIKRLTATTSKTAIATLSAVILILIISVSVSSSVRFFCLEHPGILIVVIAVAGEVICDWNRKKTLKERLKKIFGSLLVTGLLWEVAEAVQSDKKAAVALLEAKQASERAANTESNNLVLKKQLVALEQKMQPRTITPEQITNFIFLTAKIPKFPVRVATSSFHSESFAFATQIRNLLNKAGYITPASDTNESFGIHVDPTAFSYDASETDVVRTLDAMLCFFTDNTNSLITFHAAAEETNNFKRLIIPKDDTNNTYAGLLHVFDQIGMTYGPGCFPNWVGSSHCGIFVLEKPY